MTVDTFSDKIEYDLTIRKKGSAISILETYPSARQALDAAIRYIEDGASFYSLIEVHVSTRSEVILQQSEQ